MKSGSTLEDLVKSYLKGSLTENGPLSYDLYNHKNNVSLAKTYSDAVSSLYKDTKRSLSTYGTNSAKIHNKGLQNSGYAQYVDDLSDKTFNAKLASLEKSYAEDEAKNRASYVSYLDKYESKQDRLKKSVMSHLIGNEIVDLGTAVAYGMSAGLSKENAELIGQSVYEVTKQKVFNKVLEQSVSLGLDKEGAKMLAIKMGVSSEDAASFADEIAELMSYYGNITEDYLDYLEQRSK